MFWSMTKGHQLDCGAFIPTSTPAAAKDVWQEGLQLPPIKFYEKGKQRDDVVRMYLANVRWQEWLYGDLMAQLGSIWTGKRRLIELAAHYGNDEVERYIEAIFDYADQRMAQEIRQMPDGDYEGTSWLDTDGQGGTDIPVNARVSIRDDRVHVDFGGSAPQDTGRQQLLLRRHAGGGGHPDPLHDRPPRSRTTTRCLRHITAEAPLGSVCNAQYPASTALATIGPDDTMQDAVYKALAHAVPERVTGGNGRVSCVPFFSGTDTRDGQDRSLGLHVLQRRAGGRRILEGGRLASAHHVRRHGRTQDPERRDERDALTPCVSTRQEIGADSMGHGEHHGGPGVEIQITPIGGPIECHLFGDGTANPPHGVMGGTTGIGGGSYKENLETGKRTYCSSKGLLMIEENEVLGGALQRRRWLRRSAEARSRGGAGKHLRGAAHGRMRGRGLWRRRQQSNHDHRLEQDPRRGVSR